MLFDRRFPDPLRHAPTTCAPIGRRCQPAFSIKGGRPIRDHLYYCYMDNQRSISDGIWKLIEYHVNGERTTQLFKLKDDPWEMNNLSGQKKYRKIIQRLREKMIEDQRKTNDTSIFWNNFSY